MMKTKAELNALKAEVEALNKKLAELSDAELAQVSGGTDYDYIYKLTLVQPDPEPAFEYEPSIDAFE